MKGETKMQYFRFTVLVLLCLYSMISKAQEVKVESFETLTRDLLARTQERLDLNDVPCAVVRISVANSGNYLFEGNVVGDVIYSPGEAIIYMPHGSRRLTVKSNDFGTFTYEFPERLQKQTVYRMVLVPAQNDMFSAESLAEARRIVNRYLEKTGLKGIMDKGVSPSYHVKADIIQKGADGYTVEYESVIMLDPLSKKMFFKGYGQAIGRNGDKYWGGVQNRIWPLEKDDELRMAKGVYEQHQDFYNLKRKWGNPEILYVLSGEREIDGKKYQVIRIADKDTKSVSGEELCFDSETGLLGWMINEVGEVRNECADYTRFGELLLPAKVTNTRKNAESVVCIYKDVCIDCPVDDSLLNQKAIRKASKIVKNKKK